MRFVAPLLVSSVFWLGATAAGCNADNCLRALSGSPVAGSAFCNTYTTQVNVATTGLPAFLSKCSAAPSRISSACSCLFTQPSTTTSSTTSTTTSPLGNCPPAGAAPVTVTSSFTSTITSAVTSTIISSVTSTIISSVTSTVTSTLTATTTDDFTETDSFTSTITNSATSTVTSSYTTTITTSFCPPPVCSPGTTTCSGNCVDTSTDINNCGTCGTVCTSTNGVPTCSSGVCSTVCATGFGNCDGNPTNGCETNILTDPANCGGCGKTCPAGPNSMATCSAGSCGLQCSSGFRDCDGNPANGCESDTSTDPLNCSGCQITCPSGPNGVATCSAGSCNFQCAPGFGNCDANLANGCETSLLNDPMSCGSCGFFCPQVPNGHPICSGGTCSLVCYPGLANCDGNVANGCEVNLSNNVQNCGTCGTVCVPAAHSTPLCSGGVCAGQCNAGFANCNGDSGDGCEVNTNTDVNHCGSCSTVCSSVNGNPTCTAGNCNIACHSGFANCDENNANGCEVNTLSDPNNCGGCGLVCSSKTCSNGVCA